MPPLQDNAVKLAITGHTEMAFWHAVNCRKVGCHLSDIVQLDKNTGEFKRLY